MKVCVPKRRERLVVLHCQPYVYEPADLQVNTVEDLCQCVGIKYSGQTFMICKTIDF